MTAYSNPALDSVTMSNRGAEINPISSHYIPNKIAEVTGGGNGTFPYYIDMSGYRGLGLQVVLATSGSATFAVTVWATIQADGTAPADCTYADVTNSIFGVSSITASDYLSDIGHKLETASYVKVQVVVSGASADADHTIFANKLY